MKTHVWRASMILVLTFGIVSGLAVAATAALAADEPVKTASRSADEGRGGCWYIVQHGDTLFRIGLRYGVSPFYLAHLNGLWNPNLIYAGMKLLVPCGGNPEHPPKPPKPCGEPARYLVRPGDNLFRIALNHGTTVEALRDANNLWGRVLRPGTILMIPCPAPKNGEKETPLPPPDRVPLPPVSPQDQGQPTTVPPPEQGQPTTVPPPEQGQPTTVPPPEQGQPTTVPPPEQGQPTVVPSDQPPAELPPEPSASVVLGASAVDPNLVTIKPGQSVVWINNSPNIYSIVSGSPGQPDDQFTSGELPTGATWIHTFDDEGTFSYYVNENPILTGQVVVTP